MLRKQSEVVIFAGPHGGGKDTLEQMFTAKERGAVRNVRYATRNQSPEEVNGLTYHFITPAQFAAMAQRGDFIEEAQYPDGSTGTSLPDLLHQMREFRYVCLTMNFADGLLLSERLNSRGVANRCLFVGPCTEDDMLSRPNIYLPLK